MDYDNREEWSRAVSNVSELVKRIDQACCNPSLFWPHKVLRDCRSALTAQQQEIERLREALEPFSAMAGEMFIRNYELKQIVLEFGSPNGRNWLTFDDFVTARAALTGKENGSE